MPIVTRSTRGTKRRKGNICTRQNYAMDTSYLAKQVNSSISQLHGLFDEIGVPEHEREERESEVSIA